MSRKFVSIAYMPIVGVLALAGCAVQHAAPAVSMGVAADDVPGQGRRITADTTFVTRTGPHGEELETVDAGVRSYTEAVHRLTRKFPLEGVFTTSDGRLTGFTGQFQWPEGFPQGEVLVTWLKIAPGGRVTGYELAGEEGTPGCYLFIGQTCCPRREVIKCLNGGQCLSPNICFLHLTVDPNTGEEYMYCQCQ